MDWSNILDGEDGLSVRNKLNNLGKAAAPLVGTETCIFKLEGADLNSTADQIFEKLFDFDDYVPVRVIAMDASEPVVAATGGIYTAPSKGGIAVVAGSQAWTNLSAPSKVIYPSIPNAGMAKLTGDLYLSLTTPMGSAATCNFYILGFIKP